MRPRTSWPRILPWIIGLSALTATPGSFADHLHFSEGGGVRLPSSIDGADVVLDTPMGLLRFPRGDFSSIDSTPEPAREWPKRRGDAIKQGAPSRLASALWALDHGLVAEAQIAIREAHAADPSHPETSRLVRILDRLEAPCPDPELATLLRSAPRGHRIARGPHILLIHQMTDAKAAERVQFLERIVAAFALSFGSLGIELPPPRFKLPSICFSRNADYLAFLHDAGADAFGSTRGYHHPARGLVASYDCRDDATQRTAREDVEARREELARFGRSLEAVAPGARVRMSVSGEPSRTVSRDEARTWLGSLGRRLDRREMLLELNRREIDLGVAAHETVHQLVASSRLAPRFDAFPVWLQEGLAMQFETMRGGRWAGLAEPSPFRLRDYRSLSSPPLLAPLLSDAGLGRGYDRDAYARSWSFVYFLRSDRPATWISLLDALRAPTPDGDSAGSRSSHALLPTDRESGSDLEAAWHRVIDALPALDESFLRPRGRD